MDLKSENIKGFAEELYHEERNRDYAATSHYRHTANHKVARGDPMEVSNLVHVPGWPAAGTTRTRRQT